MCCVLQGGVQQLQQLRLCCLRGLPPAAAAAVWCRGVWWHGCPGGALWGCQLLVCTPPAHGKQCQVGPQARTDGNGLCCRCHRLLYCRIIAPRLLPAFCSIPFRWAAEGFVLLAWTFPGWLNQIMLVQCHAASYRVPDSMCC